MEPAMIRVFGAILFASCGLPLITGILWFRFRNGKEWRWIFSSLWGAILCDPLVFCLALAGLAMMLVKQP